jgi:hypothetical protein
MKVTYAVYYTNGTSGVIEFEKPAGALPDSLCTAVEGGADR